LLDRLKAYSRGISHELPRLPWIFSIYHSVIFILFAFWSFRHLHPPLLILVALLELPTLPAAFLFGKLLAQLSDPIGVIGVYLVLLGAWIIYGLLLERWRVDRKIGLGCCLGGILILVWAMLGGILLHPRSGLEGLGLGSNQTMDTNIVGHPPDSPMISLPGVKGGNSRDRKAH